MMKLLSRYCRFAVCIKLKIYLYIYIFKPQRRRRRGGGATYIINGCMQQLNDLLIRLSLFGGSENRNSFCISLYRKHLTAVIPWALVDMLWLNHPVPCWLTLDGRWEYWRFLSHLKLMSYFTDVVNTYRKS